MQSEYSTVLWEFKNNKKKKKKKNRNSKKSSNVYGRGVITHIYIEHRNPETRKTLTTS